MPKELNNQEMLKLLAGLRQAKLTELHAYEKAWPEPTTRQMHRIEKARKAYEDAKEKHQTFKRLIANF